MGLKSTHTQLVGSLETRVISVVKCWKSAIGASPTNQQAVRDKVMEYCRATPK